MAAALRFPRALTLPECPTGVHGTPAPPSLSQRSRAPPPSGWRRPTPPRGVPREVAARTPSLPSLPSPAPVRSRVGAAAERPWRRAVAGNRGRAEWGSAGPGLPARRSSPRAGRVVCCFRQLPLLLGETSFTCSTALISSSPLLTARAVAMVPCPWPYGGDTLQWENAGVARCTEAWV